MNKTTRRDFLKATAVASLATGIPAVSEATTGLDNKRVIVRGGGFAGATAAKYLRRWSDAEVILIEPNAAYHSCILSNLVLTGDRSLDAVTFNYDNLQSRYGITVLEDSVARVDSANLQVFLASDTLEATPLSYDKLVLAPGVAFKFPNWAVDFDTIPHAWKAGPQIAMLKNEIDGLQDNDLLVIKVPKGAFRCPPGPYERTCAIADYLNKRGVSVNIKLVDPNDTLSGQNVIANVFIDQFGPGNRYPNVEYLGGVDISDIDVNKRVTLSNSDVLNADAVNYIPDQQAPQIVRSTLHPAGTQEWASVNPLTYASTSVEVTNAEHIHVIGDSQATAQPKAGHIANAEAKVCADAIIRGFLGMSPYPNPMTNSACFTPVNHNEASWISAVYRYDGASIVTEKVGNSPRATRENHDLMFSWANNLFDDTFG